MKIDMTKYMVPALGILCVAGALGMVSAMRTPFKADGHGPDASTGARMPESLVLNEYIPTMEEVVAKHLFVPERLATGENAFPDLLVKGVYVGSGRSAVFSLKSKPEANLRIWQGDEDAALAQVVDERDPRKPIADFLHDWQIKDVTFEGVTLEHIITGETETYLVDYTPAKKVKDNAQGGYGQGVVMDATPAAAVKAPAAQAVGPRQPGQPPPPGAFSPQAVAGRVGAFMQSLSPEQRQQFMQQLGRQQQGQGQQNQQQADGQKRSGTSKNGSSSSRSGSTKKRN
ncbi:MAG: hypothetical protein K9M54_07490 [Kiritimatiellales bacterium]|nr:hypothetical protein [Kiritimatiellales bacterium]MCF7864250.1 hypothetical protein [Kiritimatiellales bacterium]